MNHGENTKGEKFMGEHELGEFGYDLKFLKDKDEDLIVLSSDDRKSQVVVSAKYQGKVFTSTANGVRGKSLGFVNYNVLNSKERNSHMNAYGGENRFWLGPEGGAFSVFFKEGKEQIFENWHTPAPIDTETWNVVAIEQSKVVLTKDMKLLNYKGSQLELVVDRNIELLSNDSVSRVLDLDFSRYLNVVAYSTYSRITNLNDFEWTPQTGTICIWILDMFKPSPNALTFIPFNQGGANCKGKIATTDYFGEIPATRLKVKDGFVFLKTDGEFRSKLGMNNKRSKAIAGNYDPDSKHLIITVFDADSGAIYLNQEWNPNQDPLTGDVLNAYNDGPLSDGSILGPFHELESVSPAAFLRPGESMGHRHTVYHFVGEEKELSGITEKLFGIAISELKQVF